jgi:RNA polymerase sigma factor (sigma-70 family)
MREPTVFIVDDDPSSRKGVTRLLGAAGFNAESFASASGFLASGQLDAPGCIVLDVRMPEMTGPELQTQLDKIGCCLPIVFLSAHADVPTAALAMRRGAVDFLTKPVERDDLLRAVRQSLDKDERRRKEEAEVLANDERFEVLTPREREVMTYVIAGLLNKQIAGELGISEETVKTHRHRMMRKLSIWSVAELVRICDKSGIPPAEPRKL